MVYFRNHTYDTYFFSDWLTISREEIIFTKLEKLGIISKKY